MKSIFLSGVICGLFYLGAISAADAGNYLSLGCDDCGGGCNASCGGEHNWWSLKGCGCQNDCYEDCGHPGCGLRGRSCDPCGNGCRPMTCHDKTYCGPLTPLFALFTHDSWSSCGCGQRYWGDFYGDPPDCCDPCDRCGNYIGGGNGCGGCSSCGGSGYGSRGCNCGGSQPMMEQTSPSPVPMEGRVISQGTRVSRQIPTPAAKTRKVVNQ
jgi:hypothetical protein